MIHLGILVYYSCQICMHSFSSAFCWLTFVCYSSSYSNQHVLGTFSSNTNQNLIISQIQVFFPHLYREKKKSDVKIYWPRMEEQRGSEMEGQSSTPFGVARNEIYSSLRYCRNSFHNPLWALCCYVTDNLIVRWHPPFFYCFSTVFLMLFLMVLQSLEPNHKPSLKIMNLIP